MQVANQNAPGQPSLSSYDFSQRPNVGVQLAQGLGAVGQEIQQNEAAQKLSDFQKAFGQAYAAGDRDALRQLAATNPDQIETIRQGMGFVDADRNQAMGDMSARLNIAAVQGPEAVMRELATHQNTLQQIGVSPEQAWQTYQQSPEGFTQLTDLIGMHAVGPEKYFDIQDKLTGREIDRGRLAETIRSNQAGEALQQRGQDITVRGQNISAKNAELSREIQRAELQDKVLDRQIARETNQIKLDELKQKQADVRQKAEIARADRQAAAQGAVDTFSTALDSLNEIEQSPGLSKAVGIRSAFPTVPGSDAANFEARLDTFKAQTFLPMVQSLKGMGALSDAEGKKLSDAVGALSPKMSEKAFRDSIGKIRNQLESKLSTVKKQFDYQEPVQNMPGKQSPAGSNFSSLWGD
ncbi:acyltransferase [Salmonella enterica subsp. enterica]|uniref:Acyltransferase n=3 Tax=Enterobacterales TaxID=91347 RepID=A0A5Y3XBQ6_SALER|nr:acyltransferase [Salmonella enterica subsp. enterica serovar Karamoja]EAW1737060.1 acyltransferase [Salmonella enterica subsp. enterica]EBS3369466.1 acyltransferase [Salmonella enterica subsp. enterica serovar Millesi]ECJ4506684.1 acyltransferase [Salmonella enterica subsp. salamae]EED5213547.1 acyltransferase [Salmonella enterica subsp. enterica serovar Hvittingfoss]EHJ2817510.1 acyltransferase [Salmonella enterica]